MIVNLNELLPAIKPFVLKWFEEAGVPAGVGAGFAPSPHSLSGAHHSGLLDDAQAPQFLKADGTRPLTGNLTVGAGITIDGVDISTLATSVLSARLLTAGAGLTGGGDLSADRTFNVGAGTGIAVAADSVAVDQTAAFAPTWLGVHTFTAAKIITPDIGASVGQRHTVPAVASDTLALLGAAQTLALKTLTTPTIASFINANHDHSAGAGGGAIVAAGVPVHDIITKHSYTGGAALDVFGLSAANIIARLSPSANPGAAASLLKTDGAGLLQLASLFAGSLIGTTLSTTNVGTSLIPDVTDTRDLGSSTKLWRKGWLSEMDALLFAKNTISVVGGWMLIAKGEGTIPVGMDVAMADTAIDFGQSMATFINAFVIFRAAGFVEYVKVLSLSAGTRYNVTRNLDGTGANDWPAGSVFVVLGVAGDGRIELNATDTPRISIFKQGATFNTGTEVVRIGDVNGLGGAAVETYGFYAGDGTNYFRYDPLTAPNFQIKAGGGAASIDTSGFGITAETSSLYTASRSYHFLDSATAVVFGGLYGVADGVEDTTLLYVQAQAGHQATVGLSANRTGGGAAAPAYAFMHASNSAPIDFAVVSSAAAVQYAKLFTQSGAVLTGLVIASNDASAVPNAMLDVRGNAIVTGKLGIGTADVPPPADVQVRNSAQTELRVSESTNDYHVSLLQQASTSYLIAGRKTGTPAQNLSILTGGVERVLIHSTGLVGFGVAGVTPLEKIYVLGGGVGVSGATVATTGLALLHASAAVGPYVAGNTDSAGNSAFTGGAVRLHLGGGGFSMATSPSTAAGSPRTFTSYMNMTLTGLLSIGGGSPAVTAVDPVEIGDGTSNSNNLSINSATAMKTYFGMFNDIAGWSINRKYSSGVFKNTGRSHAEIQLDAASGASAIRFYTAAANNTNATLRMTIAGEGGVTVAGAFGVNGAAAQAPFASGGAPAAGGAGTAAGGYDTAAHRDGLITLVANIRAALVAVGIMS